MNRTPHSGFRVATLLLAAVLAVQCAWLVLAELLRSDIDRLPVEAAAAATAAAERGRAKWAASIGAVRGALWAESSFSYADVLLSEGPDSGASAQQAERARAILVRALENAPHLSGAWLLLAGLGLRYRFADVDAALALKMSYYTGPNERDLIPLRLRIAVRYDILNDMEIREFVGRDLRLLLARGEIAAVTGAYNAGAPAGRRFMEFVVREINPSVAETMRSTARKQRLPD